MSIIPAGKKRLQVNQGGFKHESILGDDLFKKLALAPGSVIDSADQDVDVPSDLQSALNQGNLDRERNMPEGADMGGRNRSETSVDPETQQLHGELGGPESQTMGGGGFEQSLEAQYGPRVARIVAGFLNELREAEMMSATFTPDPMGTKFTIGGGGLELKVPAMRGGTGRLVEKA